MAKKVKPALVVSVHDVTPKFFLQIKKIVDELKKVGVSALVLKVIPNYESRNNILLYPPFLSWLREMVDSGSEIVLHGLTHFRPQGHERRKLILKDWLARGEDEFSDLNEVKAEKRILEGKKILQTAGFHCFGFTAPTWRISQPAVRALKQAGFFYLTVLTGIIDLIDQRRIFSPAFGHQGIQNFFESLMGLGNSLGRLLVMPHLRLIRIVFHPRQIDHPNFKKSIGLVSKLLPYTEPMTYSLFLGS